jgi:hypothetical protein
VRQSPASKDVNTEVEDLLSVRMSGSAVVTICKCSINPVTNPNPVCSLILSRDNFNKLRTDKNIVQITLKEVKSFVSAVSFVRLLLLPC